MWNWRSLAVSAASARSFGDLFGRDVDADDLAVIVAVGMPIGDPETLVGLVGALARDLNAGDGIAGAHDRGHDAFDRVRQRRHAVSHIAPEMVLDGDAADIGQALVDLEVAAVGGQEGKADRRGVIDQLQGRLLRTNGLRKRRRQTSRYRGLVGRHWLLLLPYYARDMAGRCVDGQISICVPQCGRGGCQRLLAQRAIPAEE